jgi:sulfur relay (sulfurtransferase) complex TusBCD TusD component (DsrE family)
VSRVRLEKEIEKVTVGKADSLNLKAHVRHWPDRIFFFANGVTVFVEFKAPGEKPRAGQKEMIKRLKKLGFPVYVVDNLEQAKKVLEKHHG